MTPEELAVIEQRAKEWPQAPSKDVLALLKELEETKSALSLIKKEGCYHGIYIRCIDSNRCGPCIASKALGGS